MLQDPLRAYPLIVERIDDFFYRVIDLGLATFYN